MSKKHPLLVVDIQPMYDKFLSDDGFDKTAFAEYLNCYDEKVYYMFNGEDVGCDTIEDVCCFLYEIGVDEHTINHITFIEKDYGWIREEMDEDYGWVREEFGTDEVEYRNWSIEDTLSSGDADYAIEYFDCLPNKMIVCGGGASECLEEVCHTLKYLGKKFEINPDFIYGGEMKADFSSCLILDENDIVRDALAQNAEKRKEAEKSLNKSNSSPKVSL